MSTDAESWDADFADGGGREERTDVLLPNRLRERAGASADVEAEWDVDFDGTNQGNHIIITRIYMASYFSCYFYSGRGTSTTGKGPNR